MFSQTIHWIFRTTSGKLVLLLGCFTLLWVLLRFIRGLVTNKIQDHDRRYRTKKLIDFAKYISLILLIVILFGNNTNNLSVPLGIAGAGIAFALQEVITSVAGWLAVVFGGFYRTGDRIQLGGIKGDVIDIAVLRTTLMEIGQWVDGDLYNGRIVRVANSFVFKEPVFNYSGDLRFLWDEVRVSIQYNCNHKKTREVLTAIANEVCGNYSKQAQEGWQTLLRKYLIENARTEPMVTIMAKENWIEYTIRYMVDYKKRRSTRDRIFSRILEEAAASNGDIRFAAENAQLVQWVN
ncbi:MAG TPA: mechanosensitive ion channel domain-containing protein [Puia sp.]|nr:mechanosensitive ion channel domain-containing protein [Puia sp.]